MQRTIKISTPAHNGLYNITRQVEAIVSESGVKSGMVNVYAQGATSAIMILFIYRYPELNLRLVLFSRGNWITSGTTFTSNSFFSQKVSRVNPV